MAQEDIETLRAELAQARSELARQREEIASLSSDDAARPSAAFPLPGTLLDDLELGAVVVSMDTLCVQRANSMAAQLLGKDGSSLSGMPIGELVPLHVFETAQKEGSTEPIAVPSSTHPLDLSVRTLASEHLLILRPQSSDHARSHALVDEMTRGALQTLAPLAVKMASAVGALERGRSEPQRYVDGLLRVSADFEKICRRMRQTCHDIPLDVAPLPLRQPLENALSSMMAELRESGVEVRGRHQPDTPPVDGDLSLLRRAFQTLLCDAWDGLRDMGEGGRVIEVGTRTMQNSAVARIWFSGLPLDEEEREGLFRPFSKNGSLRRAAAVGIIEAHGGTVELTLPRSGGVAFLVSLPASE